MRFIGDVHGKFKHYREIIRDVPASIQVGDMGVGFRRQHGDFSWYANPPFDAMKQGRHLFIRGNHDNPSACKQQRFWIPDGMMLDEGIFCVGGAVSIDRHLRTEGWDWWADEECSMRELQTIVDDYSRLKPDIVVSHECPDSIANEIMSSFRIGRIEDGSRTRQALEIMFQLHQPKFWFFGHWHRSMGFERQNVNFRCLDELEFVDI